MKCDIISGFNGGWNYFFAGRNPDIIPYITHKRFASGHSVKRQGQEDCFYLLSSSFS